MNAIWAVQSAAERLASAQSGLDTPVAQRLMGIVGIAVMIGIAYALSYNRRRIDWRLVGMALALQLGFALLVLKTSGGRAAFRWVGDLTTRLLGFQEQGARFVFGNLVQSYVPVGTLGPGGSLQEGTTLVANTGAFFAFNVLPTIIFFSALMSVLYHLNVMQLVVKAFAWLMEKTLRTSGAETLSASANVFLGQIEAPLTVKSYVPTMTISELMNVMVCGFATVAGGVLAAYIGMLAGTFPNIAGHLLAASVISTPAGILVAKIIAPETETPVTKGTLGIKMEKPDAGVIDAAASGALQGLTLALNVAAMLIAFVALIAMLNAGLGWIGGLIGLSELSFQGILGFLLRPLAWVMGVPWQDSAYVGGLIGVKTVLNEYVAFAQFGADLSQGIVLQPRSAIILAYALLGFANFGSIAIQLGGIGGLAPERRHDLGRLGLRAMIAGNLATFMSASMAGMLA